VSSSDTEKRPNLTESIKESFRRVGLRRPVLPSLAALGRRWVQRRLPTRFPRYGEAELRSALERVGVGTGATILVHSAWDEFYNFTGTPVDLVRILQRAVGPEGTIAMPAYPLSISPQDVFDVRRTATGAGLVPELLRRLPGVRRSINLVHSVAAIGPNADFLVRDHHRSETPWDKWSPYARLAEVDAILVCLGLPRSFGFATAQHCPESLLYHEIPYFRRVFGEPVTYRYRDESGQEGTHRMRPRTGRFHIGRIRRYIDPAELRVTHLSNLRIQAISAPYLIGRMVELGRRGITMYYWPLPRRRLFQPEAEAEDHDGSS
jgi:aminoglycoside 3-N-acetyltransferase